MKAAWLGDWQAPWPVQRGRRFGDPAWTLFALTQAWLRGGRERRWPKVPWGSHRQRGPWMEGVPEAHTDLPDPEWVALLRHGSRAADPLQAARGETELETWCWESLLQGDAEPWLASGSVHVDLATRLRWIPLLGAVDDGGRLHLPSFLSALVPKEILSLPPGWWTTLLGSMDAEGRLLPAGHLPQGLEGLLRNPEVDLGSLILPRLPLGWEGRTEGIHRVAEGLWMIDPRWRAWSRGQGASPEAFRAVGAYGLAEGEEPTVAVTALLRGRLPLLLPDQVWNRAVEADLEGRGVNALPEPSGDPVFDRLRVRWGGALPDPSRGYPEWGVVVHPCADPFHWMVEGRRAIHEQNIEGALRAFTWAHAHFQRLGSSAWAQRAASNAATAALRWCDLPGTKAWRRLQGPLPEFNQAHEEAELLAARGEWAESARRTRKTLKQFPERVEAWIHLALAGLFLDRREWVEAALPGVPAGDHRKLLEAWLAGFEGPPPQPFTPDEHLLWEAHRSLRGEDVEAAFWSVWATCTNQVLRLQVGLQVLEANPGQANPGRLVALQHLVDRAQAPLLQERLKALWPIGLEQGPEVDPATLLRQALGGWPGSVWVVWAGKTGYRCLGVGDPPSEALLGRVHREGHLAPLLVGDRLWWGFPLKWEGLRVGAILMTLDPAAEMVAPAGLLALAPWVARLLPEPEAGPAPEPGALLTDGSEPMRGLLQELERVAPTELPVLILGPTGSGKELTARELHLRSGRTGPLVPVNCSAFAETLMESELFGHVKGAFTGADRDRKGAIEMAEGGTLFLDEVGDLSPRLQSLFLRVLQEHEVRRVGSDRTRRVDVRFVAATHKSLEQLAAAGAFRRDLLFRLQGTVLTLPGLEARRHEFPYLVPRLLSLAAQGLKRPLPVLAPGLAEALARRPWPGNFRELGHALERALLRCGKGPLQPEHFPELAVPESLEGTWERGTRDFQRRFLLETLQRHAFHMTEAARTLGLTRVALYLAAKRLGIDLVVARQRWEGDAL